MFGFCKDAAPALGLDLASDALRLAAIRPTRQPPSCRVSQSEQSHELLGFAVEPLPPNSLIDGRLTDVAGVARAVRRAWEWLDVETRALCLALPSSLCMQRVIEVEAGLPALELEALVELEAARAIPYPLEDIALDHFPLMAADTQSGSDPNRMSVLMVAARKDDLEERLAVVREAGLQCRILDVDSQIFRLGQGWLSDAESGVTSEVTVGATSHAILGAMALIDVGADRLCLHVFESNGQTYSREQPLDLQNEPWVAAAPLTESLVAQIQLALRFHASSRGNQPIERLQLSGLVDRFPGLLEQLRTQLGQDVHMADPSAGLMIQWSDKTRAFREQPARGLLACALALRGLHE